MAPIRPDALMGRLSTSSSASFLPTGALPIREALPRLYEHITPSIAFQRIARVLFESLSKRDDDSDSQEEGNFHKKHLDVILPLFFGSIFVGTILGCTRSHFKEGGTWGEYGRLWLRSISLLLCFVVPCLCPLLGSRTTPLSRRAGFRASAPAASASAVASAPAAANPAYPQDGDANPPPPYSFERPQMPLGPVVVMPDLPNQQDPDAVYYDPSPPPNAPAPAVIRTRASNDGRDGEEGHGIEGSHSLMTRKTLP